MKNLVVVDGHEDRAVLRQQVAGEGETLEHELQPERVPPVVVLVHEAVVIDEVAVAGVVGRIDVDALHFAGVGHAQRAQGIEVVAFDDEVRLRAVARAEFGHFVERDEIGIERAVVLDGVAFPDEAEFFPVARLQQRDELLVGEIAVIRTGHQRKERRSFRGGRGVRKSH